VALACCFGKLEADGNTDYYIDSLLVSWHNLYLLRKAQETFAVQRAQPGDQTGQKLLTRACIYRSWGPNQTHRICKLRLICLGSYGGTWPVVLVTI
jgi:hypothetical protein